jgi:hypothetical protein
MEGQEGATPENRKSQIENRKSADRPITKAVASDK